MRKSLFAGTLAGGIGLLASAGVLGGLMAVAPGPEHHMGRTRYGAGTRPRRSWYIPHQGPREIERRIAQQERDRERQLARGQQQIKWEAGLFGLPVEDLDVRISRRGNVL